MDPSGTYIECQAKAIGAASEGAQQSLQDEYTSVIIIPENVQHRLICVYAFNLQNRLTKSKLYFFNECSTIVEISTFEFTNV